MKNALIVLGGAILGAAAIVTTAVLVSKTASASPKTPPQPASPITVPAQLVQGRRYKLTITAPNAVIQTDGNPTVAEVQAFFDQLSPGTTKVISTTSSTGTGGTGSGVVVFDVVGPTIATPALPPNADANLRGKGVTLVVVDVGASATVSPPATSVPTNLAAGVPPQPSTVEAGSGPITYQVHWKWDGRGWLEMPRGWLTEPQIDGAQVRDGFINWTYWQVWWPQQQRYHTDMLPPAARVPLESRVT